MPVDTPLGLLDPPKNDQEAFDRAWQAFVVEKRPFGSDFGGNCVYLGELNGTTVSCAIGVQLSNHLLGRYGGSVRSISCLNRDREDISEWFKDCSEGLLSALQVTHDNSAEKKLCIREQLADLAETYGLTTPE